MFGTSLIVCVSLLIHGIAAKPLNKLSIQDTIMNEKAEEHWGLQVEPPKDLDVTSYDIDPSMKIWQRVAESGPDGKYQMAEGDLDELHHLSMVEVVPVKQEVAPGTDAGNVPGPDEEELHYKVVREYLAVLAGNIGRARLEPEEDMDHVYHGVPVDVPAPVGSDVMSPPDVRLHSEPEEDLDDLYHADLPAAVQVEVQAPAGSDITEQMAVRLHLEPEEDLDDLYHQDQIVPVGPYQELNPDAVQLRGPLSWDQETQRERSKQEADIFDL